MHCHNCGKEVKESAAFCGYCGQRFDEYSMSNYKIITPMQQEAAPTDDIEPATSLEKKLNQQENIKRKQISFVLICVAVGVLVAAVILVFLFVIKPNLEQKKQMKIQASEEQIEKFSETQNNLGDIIEEDEDPSVYAVSMDAIASIDATSFLVETDWFYPATNLRDRNKETAWSEGVSGDGVGERVSFNFSSKQYITGMAIRNGFQKSTDLFEKNSRVNEMEIEDRNGNGESIKLTDTENLQIIEFATPIYSNQISLIIRSVYKGSAYEDTCLSEIEFFGSQESQERLERESLSEENDTESALGFPREMFVQVDELLVRTGPGTNYMAIWKLYTGDRVYVYNISDGWACISWSGSEAYVSAQYVADKYP